jgi:beta-aspartyl-peptidase (threonine type)
MRAFSIIAALLAANVGEAVPSSTPALKWALAIHGGAGTIDRASITGQSEQAYREALGKGLDAAARILAAGGTALDAVESAIRLMEDDPLFNAGRGAVFTAAGRNELDAAIMDGASLNAGAVTGVTRVRHPITLARAIMESSPHVMLAGEGAESFARLRGLEIVDPSFFFTQRRWQELERTLMERGEPIPPRPAGAPQPEALLWPEAAAPQTFGTVGVVALDSHGNLAAGTSTGGTTGKLSGRVGDSPIIGAGTYASNQSCAVSGTGTGEFFIRLTVAREVCALMQYKNYGAQRAADEVIQKRLMLLRGSGGIIVISPKGEVAWSFNTPGMYRAMASSGGMRRISIFRDEP